MSDHTIPGAGRPPTTDAPRTYAPFRIRRAMREAFDAAVDAANITQARAVREAVDRHLARNVQGTLPPQQNYGDLVGVRVELAQEHLDALDAEAERRGGSRVAVLRGALGEWLAEREVGS